MKLLLVALCALSSLDAFAMCVSTTYTAVAWSKDGQAVIVEEEAHGPEGGGSITFDVIDFRRQKPEVYNVSSTFSPGDGTEPQTISEDACKAALAKANQALAKLGFDARFKSDPKACRKDRDDLIKGKEKKDLSIEYEKVSQMALQVGLPGHGASANAFSKNGKLAIIVENNGQCDSRCYRVKPGDKPDTYKNDGPCQE